VVSGLEVLSIKECLGDCGLRQFENQTKLLQHSSKLVNVVKQGNSDANEHAPYYASGFTQDDQDRARGFDSTEKYPMFPEGSMLP